MDFRLSSSDAELYQRALAFARDTLNPILARSQAAASEREAQEAWREAWRALAGFDLFRAALPERDGGLDLPSLSLTLLLQGLGAGARELGLLFSAGAHLVACLRPIAEFGGDELKRRTLGRLASGEWIGAHAISEAEAGSDVFALRAEARRQGDFYLLSGTKIFVTNGPVADAILVYAKTSPEDGYLGISAFVVERGSPGLDVGKPVRKVGLGGSPVGALYFTDCKVPVANRLGAEGQGAAVFQASMAWERTCLFGLYLGRMERGLDDCVRHASARKQFKKPIGKQQAVSHRIADMKVRLEAARLLLYKACCRRDRGEDATLDVAIAKLAVTEAALAAGLDAVRIHGGAGVLAETGVADGLTDALPSVIFSGTSDIQRDLIARSLGL